MTVYRRHEVSYKSPPFQGHHECKNPRFAHSIERECARLFDYHEIPWEYEPHTFILEEDSQGRVTEAITPDFYLPEENIYIELTVMRQSLTNRKNRKLRKLRERYPEIQITMLYRRDLERLGERYGFSVGAV